MAAQIDFNLQSAGWATIEVSAGTFIRKIDNVSYTTDALDDMLRMGIDIATDKGWSFAVFDHEPATTVLVAETGWWEYNNWVCGARLSTIEGDALAYEGVSWDSVHKATRSFILPVGSRDELAALFLRAAERVLEAHGVDGYEKAWGGRLAFPMRGMKALQAALSCPAAPAVDYGA